MTEVEQTLVLIKPDGMQRGLVGEILKRFEQRGLKLVGLKMVQADKNLAEQHYTESIAEKHGEHVRESLLQFVTEHPVIAMVIQGSDAISLVRKIVGSTFPGEADIGTIRGDYCHASKAYVRAKNKPQNLVHASENQEDAKKELGLWFSVNEIFDYKISAEEAIY
jgi:nucleoside-diphosphate kinase